MAVLAGTHGTAAASSQIAEDALERARSEARAQVASFMADYYDRKIFEPYLRFASAEDEAAYREREQRRRKEIEEAQSLGTPEGDLRAAKLAHEQLKDAGAHGADKSPDYAGYDRALTGATHGIEAASAAKAQSASPADPLADLVSPDAKRDAKAALQLLAAGGVTAGETDRVDHGLAPSGQGVGRGRG